MQDLDADKDGASDLWEAWDVTYRDVVILDGNNERVGAFNLTQYDLGKSQNYEALKSRLLGVPIPEPTTAVLTVVGTIALVCRRRR